MNILVESIHHHIDDTFTIRLREALNKIHAYIIERACGIGKGCSKPGLRTIFCFIPLAHTTLSYILPDVSLLPFPV